MPLSTDVRVFIIFDGDPGVNEFEQLRRVVDLLEISYIGSKAKQVKECVKHPESRRHARTGRCAECMAELSRVGVEAQKKKRRMVNEGVKRISNRAGGDTGG